MRGDDLFVSLDDGQLIDLRELHEEPAAYY